MFRLFKKPKKTTEPAEFDKIVEMMKTLHERLESIEDALVDLEKQSKSDYKLEEIQVELGEIGRILESDDDDHEGWLLILLDNNGKLLARVSREYRLADALESVRDDEQLINYKSVASSEMLHLHEKTSQRP